MAEAEIPTSEASPPLEAAALPMASVQEISSMAAGQEALEAENLIDTYQTIAEWIRFADAKAAVSLTVDGVFLGLLVPTLRGYLTEDAIHPAPWWKAMVVVLFVAWLAMLVLSAVYAFQCILPLRGQGRLFALDRATHFHPAAIAHRYSLRDVEQFVVDSEQIGTAGLKREVLAAILLDSHLSGWKYGHVTRSIWYLSVSALFGFLYLVAIQF